MKFLGRDSELAALEKEYRRDSGFVVLYGRRRVGKTTLIKEFIKDKKALYFLATNEVEQSIMGRFTRKVSEFTENASIVNAKFNDWLDLFRLIADYAPREKKVIIIDELPYIIKVNEAFPSILQYAWDELLNNKNIMLILCGSLISMMERHTLEYDSPLYGRRTGQLRLAPLPFKVVRQDDTFDEAVRRYAITGGVPKYLEIFEDGDIFEAISENILSKNGFLYEEPAFLLKEDVREPITYYSLIEAIAKGDHKLSRIASSLQMPSTSLTPYIRTLIDLGFIAKTVPITENKESTSKRGLYGIADNFMRFWFEYVFSFRGELEIENRQIVLENINKTFISSYVPLVYEDVCRQIFVSLCLEGCIDFSPSKVGSYWAHSAGEDLQIDVAAVDNSNKRVFFGECKYHKQPVDYNVFSELRAKVEGNRELGVVFAGYKFMYGVFSKSGFTGKLIDESAKNNSLVLIDKDEVYNVAG